MITESESAIRDAIIATEIVKKIFRHILLCIEQDRSKMKLNLLEKGIIKGMISEKTLSGINGYVMKMYPKDVKALMDDVEIEVFKRKNDETEASAIRDAIIATEIVKKIFRHILLCIEQDRSKMKLNLLEKGIIKGMISEKTLSGINGYVMKMYPKNVKILMDDVEVEVLKRKKT